MGKTFEESLPEIASQPFTKLLQDAWRTNQTYTAKDAPADLFVDGRLQTFYFDFVYWPIKNPEDSTLCILHTAFDVTERLAAQSS